MQVESKMSTEDVKKLFDEKFTLGQELLTYLSNTDSIKGINKLSKKINLEIRFLEKVLNSGYAKKEHALTSNITWYEALISVMKTHDIFAVLETFTLQLESEVKKMTIDIVAKNGYQWLKVIAKNVKNVISSLEGDCSYGRRTYVDQAKDLLACAAQNTLYFKAPEVVFVFTRGVDDETSKLLSELGVIVKNVENECAAATGFKENFKEEESESHAAVVSCNSKNDSKESPLMHISGVNCLNLDVTTLLAYVSELCNGGCDFDFRDPCINYQAEQEMKEPLKPLLDSLFEGKQLVCCQSAYDSFTAIINTVGGEHETRRASEFIQRILVIDDILPQELETLKLGGKIKKRSLLVFATGHAIKAVTVTANEGFYRSTLNKGVRFAVFLHQPRPLTEKMRLKIMSGCGS